LIREHSREKALHDERGNAGRVRVGQTENHMTDESRDLEALDEQLRQDPKSRELHEQFLILSCTPDHKADPRRIEHIVAYVRHFPRSNFARCPFAHVYPQDSAEGFQRVEQKWMAHLRESPGDVEVARGLALLLAESDSPRALDILRAVEPSNQGDAELYTDIGRIPQSPADRLAALQRALDLGATQPNLLVWIGEASIDAGDLDRAEEVGRELLVLVDAARALHGDRLDWPERGHELWARASAVLRERSAARELVSAIRNHANRKHWSHTIFGVVAIRRGNIVHATRHLAESAWVVGEPRLFSYGPSFRLARELIAHDEWDAVSAFLRACRAFWDDEQLDEWLIDIVDRRAPAFPDQ
jgi:hypothetical protein